MFGRMLLFYKAKEFKSIVIGDFDLQPYSRGIMGYGAFNAAISAERASKRKRQVEKKEKLFYYNPTWKLMGENKTVVHSTIFCYHNKMSNII